MQQIPIIPSKTLSAPSRPIKPPSQKIKPGYDVNKNLDDVNKNLDDINKNLDDLINNIKNKQSRDLINKNLDDIINNIGNRKLDSADIDLSPDFDSLRNLVGEINKDKDKSDQIDYNKLAKLIKDKLNLVNLDPEDYSNIFKPFSYTRSRSRS